MKKLLSFYLKALLVAGMALFVPPVLFITPAFFVWHYTEVEWLVQSTALLGVVSLFLFYVILAIKVDEYDGWF